ncbi:MAG TPA: hypothetical protein VJX47_13050 [Candidatus Sulfotelmatobacter sp.]|nr:hypothetical protein [Candidatus Sulfotelmatobacter sp.]
MDRILGRALLAVFLVVAAAAILSSENSRAQTATPSSQPQPPDAVRGTQSSPVQSSAPPIAPNAPHISKQTRYEIIRDFETQLVYARTSFPMGTKGLQLKQGVVTPNGEELQQALNLWGPAVKPGDPAHISFVQIKNDHIHFELNGGPIRRQKWYQRVEISGANGPLTTGANAPQSNPHGSYLDVYFDKYVPEMTAAQLRSLLYPALDFNARNKEQAYLDTVPPKAKAAIQAHHVLVGMNQEMVLHAKGKPPKKVRERAGETDYEEWIYGEAPADVDFVRFVGDEVVRVETMKVDGEKIVRTDREVVLQPDKDKEAKKEKEPDQRPATAPSLRRPGEDQQDVPKPANGATPPPMMPPPDLPEPPSGPNEITATR